MCLKMSPTNSPTCPKKVWGLGCFHFNGPRARWGKQQRSTWSIRSVDRGSGCGPPPVGASKHLRAGGSVWLVPPCLLVPGWDWKHQSRSIPCCGPLGGSYIPGPSICAPSTGDQSGILQPQGKLLAPIGAEPTQLEEEIRTGWICYPQELYKFISNSPEGGSGTSPWIQPKRSLTTWRPSRTWQIGLVLRAP